MADSYVIRQGTERNTNPMFMEIMAKDLTELAKYASKCTPGSLGYLEDATVYRLGTQGTWVKVGDDFTSRFAAKADKSTTYTKTEVDAAISPVTSQLAEKANNDRIYSLNALLGDIGSGMFGGFPQNYILINPTTLEDFEDISSWTKNSGEEVDTFSAETENKKTGSQALRLTIGTPGGSIGIDKTINWDMSAPNANRISFWLYVPTVGINGQSNALSGLAVYLSSTSNFSKYFTASVGASNLHLGWNFITYSSWQNTGGESWTNNMIRLRLRALTLSGKTSYTIVDGMGNGHKTLGRCLFTFDDGFKSVYDIAYPYMRSKGMRGTCYIFPVTGNPSYMGVAELSELYDQGWAISNHTKTHANLTTLPLADVEAEIRDGRDYLLGLGFDRSAHHFCYPEGGYNDVVLNAVANVGDVLTARTVVSGFNYPAFGNLLLLRNQYIDSTVTLATATAAIDKARLEGLTVIFLIHKLTESAPTAGEWSGTNFRALVDYVASSGLQAVTIDEFYAGLQNPSYRVVAD